MLRSLGFMTGMALTAVLTLALTDDVAMDGLRRSAQTLFTGTGPAQPAALAASAGSLSADPIGLAGASRPDPDRRTRSIPPPENQDVAGSPAPAPVSSRTRDPNLSATSGAAPDATVSSTPPGRPEILPQRPRDEGMATDSGGTPSSAVFPADGASAARTTADVGASARRSAPASSNVVDTAAREVSAAVASATPNVPGGHLPGPTDELPGPPAPGLLPVPDPADGTGDWQVFWTPFHSEASAEGFAKHLQRGTGTEYEVIRTAPGEYRVAFWQESEDQRGERISAIEQASGLRLRSGEL